MLLKLTLYRIKNSACRFLTLSAIASAAALIYIISLLHLRDSGSGSIQIFSGYAGIFADTCLSVIFAGALIFPLCGLIGSYKGNNSYLTLSLPVRQWKHIAACVICTAVWCAAAGLISLLIYKLLALRTVRQMIGGFYPSDTAEILEDILKKSLYVIFIQLFIFMITRLALLSKRHWRTLVLVYSFFGSILLVIMQTLYSSAIQRIGSQSAAYLLTLIFPLFFSVIFFTVSYIILEVTFEPPAV